MNIGCQRRGEEESVAVFGEAAGGFDGDAPACGEALRRQRQAPIWKRVRSCYPTFGLQSRRTRFHRAVQCAFALHVG
jgi:hypothetical protein